MASSTRVGYTGVVEVHLKKQLEISREIADQVPQLPSNDRWYVLRYNTRSDNWMMARGFGDFESADEHFVSVTQNNGVDAGRLEVDRSGPNGREVGR